VVEDEMSNDFFPLFALLLIEPGNASCLRPFYKTITPTVFFVSILLGMGFVVMFP